MQAIIDPEVVAILVCPETQQPLHLASDQELKDFRTAMGLKTLLTVAGKEFHKEIDGLLVRADGLVGYPIESGIPILLPGTGVQLMRSPST